MSLASDVQDLHLAQRKEMASGFSKTPALGLLPDVPSLMETLSYSYCYVGIMTGEWPPDIHLSPHHTSAPAFWYWSTWCCPGLLSFQPLMSYVYRCTYSGQVKFLVNQVYTHMSSACP